MNKSLHNEQQLSMFELCEDCMKSKAEYLCDMPSSPTFYHVYVNGYRRLKVINTCDRQICKNCAIEIVPNRHCCKQCAETIDRKVHPKKWIFDR